MDKIAFSTEQRQQLTPEEARMAILIEIDKNILEAKMFENNGKEAPEILHTKQFVLKLVFNAAYSLISFSIGAENVNDSTWKKTH